MLGIQVYCRYCLDAILYTPLCFGFIFCYTYIVGLFDWNKNLLHRVCVLGACSNKIFIPCWKQKLEWSIYIYKDTSLPPIYVLRWTTVVNSGW